MSNKKDKSQLQAALLIRQRKAAILSAEIMHFTNRLKREYPEK